MSHLRSVPWDAVILWRDAAASVILAVIMAWLLLYPA